MISAHTYRSIKTALKRNRGLKAYLYVIFAFIFAALLAPWLATDKPLLCHYQGQWLFPAFSSKQEVTISGYTFHYNRGKEWKLQPPGFCIFAPCPYSPQGIDAENAPGISPFDKQVMTLKTGETISMPLRFRHWLGTTQNGNDVLACLIHGTAISVSVGFFSMLIAGLIGILLGALAGYYENTRLQTGLVQLLFSILSLCLMWFYGIISQGHKLSTFFLNSRFPVMVCACLISCFVFLCFNRLGYRIDRKLQSNMKINVPVDALISKAIEVLHSIPALLFIITLSAFIKPSHHALILIIGFLSWAAIARMARAEYLKAKQLDYVTACKAIGMSDLRIITKHILPNVWPVLMVQIIFGMAGAVLVESSLSFIGVGVPLEAITWGTLLNEARDHFSSWWLVLFPGSCLFLLIYSYHKIARELLNTIRK